MNVEGTTVEYRQLGKSGLKVSVPILGAMSFGSDKWSPWVVNEDQAIPLLKAAWDRGVTTIDTANIYSNGESERIVGSFIKQLIIATKCWGVVASEPGIRTTAMPGLDKLKEYVNQSGLSRAAIFNAVNASLERLQTSYIDLLQIHRFDPQAPVEETMKALHDLVQSGKVRYIGASSMRCWQFAMMNEVAEKKGWTKFVSMQDEYSLLYREEVHIPVPREREMHQYCNFNGIGIIPWAPLAAGDLARPFGASTTRKEVTKGTPLERKLRPSDELIIKRVEELSQKKGCTMSQVALAWALTKVSSPIVGCSSVKRLDEAIVKDVELTPKEIEYLEEPYEPKPIRGHA
ncbi:Aldo keto reductase [Heliocybe sulcata]|uniref:Aldo keto reductase n=1 Tax=Heliocybe sulcata TaxID=5364 RepID=A0A5C3N6K7_9AGAM|nr:Aldo keto reductase [Heliocybe sulcata]